MPRPPLPPEERRDVTVSIRIRAADAETLAALANERRTVPADLAREVVLRFLSRHRRKPKE